MAPGQPVAAHGAGGWWRVQLPERLQAGCRLLPETSSSLRKPPVPKYGTRQDRFYEMGVPLNLPKERIGVQERTVCGAQVVKHSFTWQVMDF